MLAGGHITIPSGLTTFMTNLPFMTNISHDSYYSPDHQYTNRSYSFLAVLKIANVTLDSDRQSFNKVGDIGSQYVSNLNMESYYLTNQQVEFEFYYMRLGYYIEGTSLRANLDLLNRDLNQITPLSNYSNTRSYLTFDQEGTAYSNLYKTNFNIIIQKKISMCIYTKIM